MKKLCLLFLFLGALCAVQAQNKYVKLIDAGHYEKAEAKINRKLEKEPTDMEILFAQSYLLSARAYKGHDAYRAYQTMVRVYNQYLQLDAKGWAKLNKAHINDSIIAVCMDTLSTQLCEDAQPSHRISAYQLFVNVYKRAHPRYTDQAEAQRCHLVYQEALKQNTEAAFRDFVRIYPYAKDAGKAWDHICDFELAKAEKSGNPAAFTQYLADYPGSKNQKAAQNGYYGCQLAHSAVPGRWRTYAASRHRYPAGSVDELVFDSVRAIGLRQRDAKALAYCYDSFPKLRSDNLLLALHDCFVRDGETISVDSFYKKYDSALGAIRNPSLRAHLDSMRTKEYALALMGARVYLGFADGEKLSDAYIREAAPSDRAYLALQYLIGPSLTAHNWAAAAAIVRKYQPLWASRPQPITSLLALIEAPWDNTIKAHAVTAANSVVGSEYVPVISADNKKLYFCAQVRPDNLAGEDVFLSRRTAKGWGKASLVSALSTKENDAPLSVSTDGNTMAYFRDGKLYYANRTAKGWSVSRTFSDTVNSGDWQGDLTFSSDGKVMIFASVRNDSYNYYTDSLFNNALIPYHGIAEHHQSDLYVSQRDSDGSWGAPVNLGPAINTIYCERSPFLHPDMKTLYFASDGHDGLGGLDIYKTTRLADSCWTCWSTPVNMGKEINTAASDWGYQVSTDGKVAYFSKASTPDGPDDIYSINLPGKLRPDYVATVSGRLVNKAKQPIDAEIDWEDLSTGKNVGISKSDPSDGTYFMVLPLGKIYGYYVRQDSFFPVSANIDLRNVDKETVVNKDINMVTFNDMIKNGTAVPINNLFFEFGKSEVLPYSKPELTRLAKIIIKSNLKVEISGHTDSIGTAETNQKLSLDRANGVRDFLIGQGCNPDLLSTVGYGNTRPVASDATEAGRSKNRRVELRFIAK